MVFSARSSSITAEATFVACGDSVVLDVLFSFDGETGESSVL